MIEWYCFLHPLQEKALRKACGKMRLEDYLEDDWKAGLVSIKPIPKVDPKWPTSLYR